MINLIDKVLYKNYMIKNAHLYVDRGYPHLINESGYNYRMLVLHYWTNELL